MNDGGAAPDRAVVQASSWQGLCDDAAFQLGLSFGVTRLFTLNGQEFTSIQQVVSRISGARLMVLTVQVASGMDLVASCGEDFVGRRTGGRCVKSDSVLIKDLGANCGFIGRVSKISRGKL